MKRLLVLFVATLCMVSNAYAGVNLNIDEDTSVDLGFRVQTLLKSSNFADPGSNDDRSKSEFLLRRARLRLGGNVTDLMSFFMQTDTALSSSDGGSGGDMRLIDAWVAVHPDELANVYMGLHMAPAGRQHTTSSGALLAMDRPAITNYNLTWGLNARPQFNTSNLIDGNLALSGTGAVRDTGLTLFGTHSFTDTAHIKYYGGVYNGIQEGSNENNKRFTGRAQFNFFDPESGYFNSATYLGKKKTIGFGASYDYQSDIATDAILGDVDYKWFELDAFAEYPLGPGSITAEAAFQNLDLGGATQLNDTAGTKDARNTQGSGYYLQTGYYLEEYKLQPFVAFEGWDSDSADNTGSFNSYKIGLNYYIKGHNAKLSAGYERFVSKTDIGSTNQDTIDTFMLGAYITY
ncbi:MAG: porin [Desulfovibrio sp.]|nr:porin [Desulfovibrio sp.]|tara:strand:- start:17701 stop:18912 length:1212 start_codon:yes stop_codon:yes gene_type:complete